MFNAVRHVPQPLRSDQECESILKPYRPIYVVGNITMLAERKEWMRLHNKQLGAVFELTYTNPKTYRRERVRYLYGVSRDGRPRELKRLAVEYL